MTKEISIKVKTPERQSHEDIKKALNLNEVLAAPSKEDRPRKGKFWPIVAFILLLIILVLAGRLWAESRKNFLQFNNIIPSDAKAVFLVKLDQLREIAPSLLPEIEANSAFYQWAKDRISQFLVSAGISAQDEIIPLFKQDIALLALPSTNGKTAWVLLAQQQPGQDRQENTLVAKIEEGLNKNFGTNELLYRQTKIKSVYSFKQIDKPYYYAQINGFTIISNELPAIQKIIDKIIGNGFLNFR